MKLGTVALSVLIFAAACVPVTVNVNVNFPTEKLQSALDEHERKINEGKVDSDKDGLPRGVAAGWRNQDIDINLKTPAIREIDKRREKRFKELEGALDKQHIGEGNDGRLYLRDKADELGAKERKELEKIVKDENKDRDDFIKEIIKANKLSGEGAEEKTREAFARARRKNARVGWWIQKPDGKWVKWTEEDKKKEHEK